MFFVLQSIYESFNYLIINVIEANRSATQLIRRHSEDTEIGH